MVFLIFEQEKYFIVERVLSSKSESNEYHNYINVNFRTDLGLF